MENLPYIILGLAGGVLSGLLGIGGATFIVPVLVYMFSWEQHMAQGTTMAMLIPPVGLLAAWQYYQAGHVNIKIAAIMCVGLFVGGYFGGMIANNISSDTLRRVFGVAMLLISVRMIIGK
ncbi:MAG: sulfite exporter TauE/SafE family protein [Bacteroidota bacterium]|jgi:uncharacterized membrane protein YfcA